MFQYGSVLRSTYDRKETAAKIWIYPKIGGKTNAEISSADLEKLLTEMMNEGYAHSTAKYVHSLLNEYFRYLCYEEYIPKNPMAYAWMIKKANFLAAPDKKLIRATLSRS